MLLICVSTLIAYLAIWLMPKRLTRQEIYCTWFVMALLTRTCDQYLDMVLHLYDQLHRYDHGGTNWRVITLQTLFPAAAGILILNFMPLRLGRFLVYLAIITLLSVGFEWLTVLTGYLQYYHWTLWYSAAVYAAGVVFLRWHIKFLRSSPVQTKGRTP